MILRRIWDQELCGLLDSPRLADLRLAATIAAACPNLLTIEERKTLRERGERVTQATQDLHSYSIRAVEEVVLHALSKGADPTDTVFSGGVPVLCKIAKPPGRITMRPDWWHDDRRTRLALAMVAAGARVNDVDTHTGRTPLHYAASWDVPNLFKTLLENGADPMVLDSMGDTPLDILRWKAAHERDNL